MASRSKTRRFSDMSAREFCLASSDFLFDMFTLLVNLADVISDIAISISWYQRSISKFFWLSIGIFFISQVAYSVFFVVLYGDNLRKQQVIALFFLVFPFAQLVPFFVWFQSYNWQWLDLLLEHFGLNSVYDTEPAHEDPLIGYVISKLRVHGGFIIESVVESVPQSIIQMIAMVMHRDTSPLATFSIITSIISICSRSFIFSYSIHRPTFAFNIICIVTDVVGLFCAVSWLFLVDPTALSQYSIPFFPDLQVGSWWSLLWIELFIALAASTIFMGLLGTILLLFDRTKALLEVILMVLVSTIMIPVGLVILQGFNLTALPFFAFRSLTNHHDAVFQGQLVDFLDGATSRQDLEERSMYASRYFARMYLQTANLRQENDWTPPLSQHYLLKYSSYIEARALCMAEPAPHFHFDWACWASFSDDTDVRIFARVSVLIFFPVLIVSSLYGVAFPFICISTTPWHQSSPLQKSLTFIVIFATSLLIMLAPMVYRFHQRASSVSLFQQCGTLRDLIAIREELQQVRKARSTCSWGLIATLIASHRAVEDPTVAIHALALLPRIDAFVRPRHDIALHGRPPPMFPMNRFFQSKWFHHLLPYFTQRQLTGHSTSTLVESNNSDSKQLLLSSTYTGYGTDR